MIPNFHIAVPAWILFAVMTAGVALATIGDPAEALGAPVYWSMVCKVLSAVVVFASGVMVVVQPAPAAPQPPVALPPA